MESPFHPEPARAAVFHGERMGKTTLWQGTGMLVGLNAFEAGQEHAMHSHAGTDKLYQVLEGRGRFQVGDEVREMTAGDLVVAPAGVDHGVVNPGPGRLVVLAVLAPPPGPR